MIKIPFSLPDITESEIDAVAEVLRSGWITTGPKTKEFEHTIAEYTGAPMAVCLSSCTASLEMTLRVLGIGPGDEVITSAYTYTASASVIDHVGAELVLVDTAPGSFHMDYDKLEAAINERTKAIIPVDLGGRLCDYEQIFSIVESKKNLFRPASDLQALFGRIIVLADSAHALGGELDGRRSGDIADFTAFSFHAVKNLTTGEGGAVTWKERDDLDNEDLYKRYMLASLHGQNKDALSKTKAGSWEYDIIYPAYKCNMTDITAAIGLAQFKRYPAMLERRHEIIDKYDKTFSALGCTSLKHYDDRHKSSGHLYLLRVPGIDEAERNNIIVAMAKKGVACNVHYKPLPMMTAYKKMGFDISAYPEAYKMYQNEISLPLYTRLTDEDVDFVCRALKEILE